MSVTGGMTDLGVSWVRDAELFTAALAATGKQFTVDEVWQMLNDHSAAAPPNNAKAMGSVVRHMGKRRGVIAPLAAWQTSARRQDRALRLFVGTGVDYEDIEVTEEHVLWALQAIDRVGQLRSQQMMIQLRKARQVAS